MSGPSDSESRLLLKDRPVSVTILTQERLVAAHYEYDRYRFVHQGPTGQVSEQERAVLQVGGVAAVLTIDPARDEVVLLRQFRLAAHLASGRGEMVEIVAGGVEVGEDPMAAAHRECLEEIGIAPSRLVPLFQFMPAPGVNNELATVFLGVVDARRIPASAGASSESEETVPFRVPLQAGLAALADGTFVNGYTVIAMQWLALNHHRLGEILAAVPE